MSDVVVFSGVVPSRADTMSLPERFDLMVPDRPADGCWLWAGATKSRVYADLLILGARYKAHRVAWLLSNPSEVIPEGMQVDHVCGVRNCVRPDHLRLVTNAENRQNLHNVQDR